MYFEILLTGGTDGFVSSKVSSRRELQWSWPRSSHRLRSMKLKRCGSLERWANDQSSSYTSRLVYQCVL